MTDYDLSRLAPRSFEHLIQALAVPVIGPHVLAWGDGPDGGREATFKGKVNYPPSGEAWEGTGIIQAKFRQRLRGTKEDGDWAADQLRDELKKFEGPSRSAPDYYIFATNVVLTPAAERGSKDKIVEILDAFQAEHGLKGHDIWDYDKLRVLLDSNESVRRCYAAYLTPGDVLACVMDWLAPQVLNFDQILTNYLAKEVRGDQYANLEQAGRASDERIPIARVMMDLPATEQALPNDDFFGHDPDSQEQGFIAELLAIGARPVNSSTSQRPHEQSGQRDGPEPGRFVLIGGPGQGKTTMGQYACQLYRAAILKSRPAEQLPPEVRDAVATIESGCEQQGLALPTAQRFPLRIVLSKLGAELASKDTSAATSVLSYLVNQINTRTNSDITANDLRMWLQSYPWFIVFDGLDEVPASSNRDQVLDAIQDFWVDCGSSDALVLATSRPQGYHDNFSPQLYRHRWLAELRTNQALEYARRLVNARYLSDEDTAAKVLQRLEQAAGNEATARLMRTPLQVTIMATLVASGGRPPEERWNLFRRYYDVIYTREVERPVPTAHVLAKRRPDIDAIHRRTALTLQVRSEGSGGTDARLTTEEFGHIVRSRLVEEGHEGDELDTLHKRILEAADQRLVFLVGLEDDQVGFEIRSLQEYMAAEALMEGEDKFVRDRLQRIAGVSSWRNVFLFAAGKCFAEVDRQHLRAHVEHICGALNLDTNDALGQRTLLGSRVALDLLEDGSADEQPHYRRAFTRLALQLLDLPVGRSHLRLGTAVRPPDYEMARQEIDKKLADVRERERLAALAMLAGLASRELGWAEDLLDAHWPARRDIEEGLFHALEQLVQLPLLEEKIWLAFCSAPTVYSTRFRRVYLDPGDYPGRNARERLLIWLHVFHVNERINCKSWNASMRFSVVPTSDYKLATLLDELTEPTIFGPWWAPLLASAEFSRAPSAAALAESLDRIASDWSGSYDAGQLHLPWIVRSCVLEAGSPAELKSLADRARHGEFGDLPDWLAAEQRWQETGVDLCDIIHSAKCSPLDGAIAKIGFPLNGYSSSRWSSGERLHMHEALAVFAELSPGRSKSALAQLVLRSYRYAIGRLAREAKAQSSLLDWRGAMDKIVEPWPPVQLLELCRESYGRSSFDNFPDLSLMMLATVSNLALDDEWVQFLTYVGMSAADTYVPSPLDHSASALSSLRPEPRQVPGLLRLLALSCPMASLRQSPHAWWGQHPVSCLESPVAKVAAAVVRLQTNLLSAADVAGLEGTVQALTARDESMLASLVAIVLETSTLHNDRPIKQLLMTVDEQLRADVPLAAWRGAVHEAMGSVIDRRNSKFGDATVIHTLGLEDSLPLSRPAWLCRAAAERRTDA